MYIFDGHAHACGEFVTEKSIEKKLFYSGANCVLLCPGEYKSKITYPLKNIAVKKPMGDVVTKNNNRTALMITLTGMIRHIPKGNEYVYSMKVKMPNSIKQCYWITKENIDNLSADFERMNFEMIKLHQCWEKFDIESDYFRKAARWAEEYNLPLFIHVRNHEQIKKLILYIEKNPRLCIVIAHLYGLEEFIKRKISAFPNVYFDLSNCNFVSKERTMLAYEYFGAKRLLFGSDTPYGKNALENTVAQIMSLDIPHRDKEEILGLNLKNLLSIN